MTVTVTVTVIPRIVVLLAPARSLFATMDKPWPSGDPVTVARVYHQVRRLFLATDLGKTLFKHGCVSVMAVRPRLRI